MHFAKRLIASFLIVSTTLMGVPLTAQAAIVPTDATLNTSANATVASQRDTVNSFLQRSDVQSALQSQGVKAGDAITRVQSMSDAEVAQLAGRIEQAPAGGDILGLLFTVFVILLVTDILGFTKVFPFTRSAR